MQVKSLDCRNYDYNSFDNWIQSHKKEETINASLVIKELKIEKNTISIITMTLKLN